MTGEYQHALDNKGRIFIPARLREELGQAVFVTLSMDRCLSVYSKENWDLLTEKVNALPYVRQRKMRPLFAYAVRCDLDAQGRILLPQNLRDWAGLVKNVSLCSTLRPGCTGANPSAAESAGLGWPGEECNGRWLQQPRRALGQ